MGYGKVKKIGTGLLALLIIMIFVSKTIYSHQLPAVTATLPSKGYLKKTETAKGVLAWSEILELYADVEGKVSEILVREGERVAQGQEIFRMTYDLADIERQLKEINISRKRVALEIENLQAQLEKTSWNESKLREETYKYEEVSGYGLEKALKEVQLAEENLQKATALYTAGGLSREDMEEAQRQLEIAEAEYEHLLETQEKTMAQNMEDKEKKEEERQKQLLEYEYEKNNAQQNIKTKELELAGLDIQEENYLQLQKDYQRHLSIYAPETGMVVGIPVKKGQMVNENQMMMSLGAGTSFEWSCDVSLENNYIFIGDTCKLSNATHKVEGIVTKVEPEENKKVVTVLVDNDELTPGETFEGTFGKESAEAYTLVPNGAVNQDSKGYFVYQIKKRNGILGEEYYSEKLRIQIGDSDMDYTVVAKGISFFEPIVLLSDKPFEEYGTVTVKNEGDFFG